MSISLFHVVSSEFCDSIAVLRRKLQRIDSRRIIFLDETAVKLNEGPRSTLVLPDDDASIEVEDTSSYAARYDMIAACNSEQVFPPMIFSPSDRSVRRVQGITKDMLIRYIQDILAQQLEALNLYPLFLILDRAPIHTPDLLREFQDMSCYSLKEILFMPAQSAKRMSPLDNSLFHYWKENIRKQEKLTRANIQQIMADEWNKISADKIHSYYHHCLLMQHQDPYADCPDPSAHAHTS